MVPLGVCAFCLPYMSGGHLFPSARRLTLGSAHCLRRTCFFPASKALLAFGAGSRKSSRQRSFASVGKTQSHLGWSRCSHLSKALDWAYVLRHVLLFLALWTVRRCVQPATACFAIYSRDGQQRFTHSSVCQKATMANCWWCRVLCCNFWPAPDPS